MDKIAVTFDVDWAPDFVVDFVADLLIEHNLRSIWFFTHPTPILRKMQSYPLLFELGIHPNLLPGSTQGSATDAVFDYCFEVVPAATIMRSHGLYQSTPLLTYVVEQTPIQVDFSLFLPHFSQAAPIEYCWGRKQLWRVPYVWEDDFEVERRSPCWRSRSLLQFSGLKVFNFHPIHVFLNDPTLKSYQQIKRMRRNLNELTRDEIEPFVQRGQGPRSFLQELMDHSNACRPMLFSHELIGEQASRSAAA